jgi:hypothetical protein
MYARAESPLMTASPPPLMAMPALGRNALPGGSSGGFAGILMNFANPGVAGNGALADGRAAPPQMTAPGPAYADRHYEGRIDAGNGDGAPDAVRETGAEPRGEAEKAPDESTRAAKKPDKKTARTGVDGEEAGQKTYRSGVAGDGEKKDFPDGALSGETVPGNTGAAINGDTGAAFRAAGYGDAGNGDAGAETGVDGPAVTGEALAARAMPGNGDTGNGEAASLNGDSGPVAIPETAMAQKIAGKDNSLNGGDSFPGEKTGETEESPRKMAAIPAPDEPAAIETAGTSRARFRERAEELAGEGRATGDGEVARETDAALAAREDGRPRRRMHTEVRDYRTENADGVSPEMAGSQEASGGGDLGGGTDGGAGREAGFTVDLRGEARSRADTGNAGETRISFREALARELRQNLSGDIVRQASVVLRDGGEGIIRLNLRPESLGNIKIRLDLTDNKITGHIVVESEEALRAFEQESRSLEQAFRESGYDGVSLELSVSGGGTQNAGDGGERTAWFSGRLESYDDAAAWDNGAEGGAARQQIGAWDGAAVNVLV